MGQNDYSNLTIEEQIIKLEKKIKFLKIFEIIFSIFIIIGSMLLLILTSEWQLAFGFLIILPFSIFLSHMVQIKEYKRKIEQLHIIENSNTSKQNLR